MVYRFSQFYELKSDISDIDLIHPQSYREDGHKLSGTYVNDITENILCSKTSLNADEGHTSVMTKRR